MGPHHRRCHTIGHKYLVCAWINDEDRSLDGYRKVGEEFTRAAETARKAGIEFAYHNHSYEFVPLSGQLPYDILLAASDPALVKFEMDLFWITKGGGDPLAYFAKYPGRFPLVHVKDMTADGRMVDVGRGRIRLPGSLPSRRPPASATSSWSTTSRPMRSPASPRATRT